MNNQDMVQLEEHGIAVMKASLEEALDWIWDDFGKLPKSLYNKKIYIAHLRIDWILKNVNQFSNEVGEEETLQIQRYRAVGLTLTELAYIFGRSKSTIHNHVSKLSDQEYRELLNELKHTSH